MNMNFNGDISKWSDWIDDITYWCENNDKDTDVDKIYNYLSVCIGNIQRLSVVAEFTQSTVDDLTEQQEGLVTRKGFLQTMSTALNPLELPEETPVETLLQETAQEETVQEEAPVEENTQQNNESPNN